MDVKQIHYGDGDNVAGDKISNYNLSISLKTVKLCFTTFIEILITPSKFFRNLTAKENHFELSIVYSIFGLIINAVIAYGINLKNGGEEFSILTIISLVLPYSVLWALWGVIFHLYLKLWKGKGTLKETVSFTLFVYTTIYICQVVLLFLLSHLFPENINYESYLAFTGKGNGGITQSAIVLNIGEVGINAFVIFVISGLICSLIYMIFPLKFIHKFSAKKIALIYSSPLWVSIISILVVLAIIGLFFLWQEIVFIN